MLVLPVPAPLTASHAVCGTSTFISPSLDSEYAAAHEKMTIVATSRTPCPPGEVRITDSASFNANQASRKPKDRNVAYACAVPFGPRCSVGAGRGKGSCESTLLHTATCGPVKVVPDEEGLFAYQCGDASVRSLDCRLAKHKRLIFTSRCRRKRAPVALRPNTVVRPPPDLLPHPSAHAPSLSSQLPLRPPVPLRPPLPASATNASTP